MAPKNPLAQKYNSQAAPHPATRAPAGRPASTATPSATTRTVTGAKPASATAKPPVGGKNAGGNPGVVASKPAAPAGGMAALRAKLAGGQTGRVNPPEAEIPEDAEEPLTEETEDGGAQLIDEEQGAAAAEEETEAPQLSRGQRAAATRAANRARVMAGEQPKPLAGTASVKYTEMSEINKLNECVAFLRLHIPPGCDLVVRGR